MWEAGKTASKSCGAENPQKLQAEFCVHVVSRCLIVGKGTELL